MFPSLDSMDGKVSLFTFLVAMLPVSEIRGAIPFGLFFKLPPWKVYLLGVGGNILVGGILLFFLQKLKPLLKEWARGRDFWEWMEKKKNSSLVEKYGLVGLTLFVALPLPVTGAWTGSLISTFFSLRIRYAFLAISLGVLLSGGIVLLASLGIIRWGSFFFGM